MNTQPMARQTTLFPTRKLGTGVVVLPVAQELWSNIVGMWWPALAGPEVSMLVGALAALAVGYFVSDRANIPVEGK